MSIPPNIQIFVQGNLTLQGTLIFPGGTPPVVVNEDIALGGSIVLSSASAGTFLLFQSKRSILGSLDSVTTTQDEGSFCNEISSVQQG